MAAAVAILGSVIGLVVMRSPHHQAPPHKARAPLGASYLFPAQRYGDGLSITRRWTLSGSGGSRLTETVTVGNPAGKARAVWFRDSIPESVATSVRAIQFHPASVKVLRADPVVEWYLRLPAHGTITVGYVTPVKPGATTAARLAGWAQGLDTVEKRLNAPAAKPTPSPRPTPTYTYVAPPPTPDTSGSGGNGNGNGGGQGGNGGGNPSPWPTYSCDPTVVTCTPTGSGSQNGGPGF